MSINSSINMNSTKNINSMNSMNRTNPINPMNSMNRTNPMNSMNYMNRTNPINPMNSINRMNPINSMNNKSYNGIRAEIIGGNGSQYLLFHLNNGQQLFCSKGNIIYQKGNIKTTEMHSDQSLVKQGLRIMTGCESYKQFIKAFEDNC